MYSRIAFVVEDSPLARKALAEALAMAGQSPDAALKLLVPFEVSVVLSELEGAESDSYASQAREEAEMLLDEFRTLVRRANVEPDGMVVDCTRAGYAHVVASEAESWKADAILLGEPRRRGLARLLGTSLAKEISKATAIPVIPVS